MEKVKDNSAVEFDFSPLDNMKNVFKKSNDQIIESLKKMKDEVENMKEVLDTPNSGKAFPEYVDYFSLQIDKTMEKGEEFDKIFASIKEEYGNYLNDVEKQVGGLNG